MWISGEGERNSGPHNEPSKGGSECRLRDCPCGGYGKFYASDLSSNWAIKQIGRSCAIGVSTVHRHLKEEYRQGNPEGFSGRVKRTFHALGSPGHRAYRRFTYSYMHVSAQ
jgi:hypothetical protein